MITKQRERIAEITARVQAAGDVAYHNPTLGQAYTERIDRAHQAIERLEP